MTEQQNRFVEACLAGTSPEEAARLAGYAPATCGARSRRLLATPAVAAAIKAGEGGKGGTPGAGGQGASPPPTLPSRKEREAPPDGPDDHQPAAGDSAAVSPAQVLDGLLREAGRGGKDSSQANRIKAWELIGKHLGMFRDRKDEAEPLAVSFEITL